MSADAVQPSPPRPTRLVLRWAVAILLWLALGFSLGWYYTFTYYGRAGWPMPTPESCAAIVLYYFSVLNVATEIQAVHWMIAFPIAGILWVAALDRVARWLALERPAFERALLTLALATVPLLLPAPWLAYRAGLTDGGFVFRRMLDVALRHGFVTPPSWLNPICFALGLVALGLQAHAYHRLYAGAGRKAWIHVPAAVIALTVAACVLGAVVALPLRFWLE